MSYDNTNSGVLFKNDRKEKDNQPDYQGSINVDGREMWLSAWIKVGAKGKFMSLAVKPKDQQQAQQREQPRRQSRQDDMDSDIPF